MIGQDKVVSWNIVTNINGVYSSVLKCVSYLLDSHVLALHVQRSWFEVSSSRQSKPETKLARVHLKLIMDFKVLEMSQYLLHADYKKKNAHQVCIV